MRYRFLGAGNDELEHDGFPFDSRNLKWHPMQQATDII
jgi:hypothetical protein